MKKKSVFFCLRFEIASDIATREHRYSWGNKFYSSISCLSVCVFNSLWEHSSFLPVTRLLQWKNTLLHFLRPFTVYLTEFHFVIHLLWMKSVYFAMNESKNDGAYTIESIFNGSNEKIWSIFFVQLLFLWLHHCIRVKSFHSFPNRIFSISTVQISFFLNDGIGTFSFSKHLLLFKKRSALFESHVDSRKEIDFADAKRYECLKFYGIQGSIDYDLATTFS